VIVFAGANNRYFSRFWRYFTDESVGPRKTYLEYIAFDQRFVYLQTAYRMYEANPALGVGLGNFAFYFDRMLPDRDYSRQPEIIRQLTPSEDRVRLVTPKNLYARLLSETGLVGAITFTAFLIAVLGCALYLWFSPGLQEKYWGGTGLLALSVFVLVMLSFDSFAVPNMWVVFGFITAAAHLPGAMPAKDTQVEGSGE
jgi:O-antigen ligase